MSGSSLRRGWLAAGWAGVLVVVYFSLKPQPPELAMVHGDKIQHLCAYAGLMLWFVQVISAGLPRARAAGWLVSLGVGLEVAQGFTGYREASLLDALANTAGVCLGWALAPPRLPNAFDIGQRWLARRGP